MVVSSCPTTGNILACTYDGHFVILRITKDLGGFEILRDISRYREDNNYRYIRHAVLRENMIAFCSELGKDASKLVVIKVTDEDHGILKEFSGGFRFCEFNREGHIYGVRSVLKQGEKDVIQYESMLINKDSLAIEQSCCINESKNLKIL